MQEIAPEFEASTGVRLRVSTASTGKLYAQIINGAPFDVLLAADRERPQRLEDNGAAVLGSRFTYARGQLVLWSREVADCRAALDDLGNGKLAIANPATAPYGLAAREFLQAEGLWQQLQPNLVKGESITQALQFAATGNARLGLVAESMLRSAAVPQATCSWRVPTSAHAPIEQQAVLLRRAADNDAALAFLAFLKSPQGRAIVSRHGYRVRNHSE